MESIRFVRVAFPNMLLLAPIYLVLRYVYYRMERVGANRNMLGHCDANKPIVFYANAQCTLSARSSLVSKF